MKALLKSILESKKTAATVVAILVWVVGRAGFDLPAELLLPVVSGLMVLVLAIGWTDSGKEKAKIDAAAKAGPTPDWAKDK